MRSCNEFQTRPLHFASASHGIFMTQIESAWMMLAILSHSSSTLHGLCVHVLMMDWGCGLVFVWDNVRFCLVSRSSCISFSHVPSARVSSSRHMHRALRMGLRGTCGAPEVVHVSSLEVAFNRCKASRKSGMCLKAVFCSTHHFYCSRTIF